MKFANKQLTNIEQFTKCLIQDDLVGLEERIINNLFSGLDPRSDIGRKILLEQEGTEVSDMEYEHLIKRLKFEAAKVIGKLESQTGINTGLVKRNKQGHVSKQAYKIA